MNPLVTVLVCAYNDEATIGVVLQSLSRLTYKPIETIVINDASSDRTPQIIQQFEVQAIHNPFNRGLVHNLNLGLEMTRGEYLAVVQSDCEVVQADWIERMMELMIERVGAVVSQRVIMNFPDLPAGARLFNAVAPQDLENPSGQPVELKYCRGKADLYRASILKEFHGWNTLFFTAGEDTDLSIRMRQRQYKILLHPRAMVRYLFSSRQASVGSSLKKALLYGQTAYLLYALYRYDGIQSRTYLAILLAAIAMALPQPLESILGILIFLFSFTCRIQIKNHNGVPFAVLVLVAWIPLIMLNLPIEFAHIIAPPAKAICLAGVTYLGYLSAKNTLRNYRKGEKVSRLPSTFLFCIAWRLLSGIGYLLGAFDFVKNRRLVKQELRKDENPTD